MQKLFFLFVVCCIAPLLSFAQQQETETPPPNTIAVDSTTAAIMAELTPTLDLNNQQAEEVQSAVSSYLTQKNSYNGLKTLNPTSYKKQNASNQNKMFKKMKRTMTIRQYSKMLGLKPKTTTALLAVLFF
ncbi:hypothetical protein LX64_04849 [Chitinophaga skermanii]|uniref:Uncharacterized protein n=1 Tax=Chitinophaga skermanii TaxID=331697 RepID=A0A327Q3Z6_9BACT|nr:hypothetical protein [Chitinophaga skermanii]RAI98487.1 hypothetical protein LX64_04849 [Chitinophaga skermanii]